jgi:hypothetical protein
MEASHQGALAFGTASLAVVAALVFTAWALTAGHSSDGSTLLQQNAEWSVRAVVAVPLLGTALVWVLLRGACSRGARPLRTAATTAALVLLALSLVAILSIGAAMLPAAVLALVAARITPLPEASCARLVHGRSRDRTGDLSRVRRAL